MKKKRAIIFRARRAGGDGGFTFIEIMMTVVIATLLVVGLARFLSVTLKGVKKTGHESQSMAAVHRAFVLLERDFLDMNQIEESKRDTIVFQMDSYRLPGYRPTANPDGDTAANGSPLNNRFDPDDDGDALTIVPPEQRHLVGYDLYDEDDDNDGAVDVKCRYRFVGDKLLRDFDYNGSGWRDETVIVTGLIKGEFTYQGSLRQMYGGNLDCGNDGNCAQLDPPEHGNGIVTAVEIDRVQAPFGAGNRSGGSNPIDTAAERRYIAVVRVDLQHDENRDGKADYQLSSDLAPPFLLLKHLPEMRP